MAQERTGRRLSKEQVKTRILRYCAYQERSHGEVRQKLYSLGLYGDEVGELMAYLIQEGFLNEERFARAFARGKFRMKRWGRIRITNDLEARGISKYCIRMGLSEIDQEEYKETLNRVLSAKAEDTHEPNLYARRNKIASFAIRKGFEPDLVWETLRTLLPDK